MLSNDAKERFQVVASGHNDGKRKDRDVCSAPYTAILYPWCSFQAELGCGTGDEAAEQKVRIVAPVLMA